MMLYVRYMVEEYAFKKWGSEQGLDEEDERREAQKKDKKDKKFKEKLAGNAVEGGDRQMEMAHMQNRS